MTRRHLHGGSFITSAARVPRTAEIPTTRDGDGSGNRAEYVAGTDPLDETKYFGLQITGVGTGAGRVVLFRRGR